MKKFNIDKDWVDFTKSCVKVNCRTVESATKFLKHCYANGVTWGNNNCFEDGINIFWNIYKEETYFICTNNNLTYDSVTYSRDRRRKTVYEID